MVVKNRCYGCKSFGGFQGTFKGNSTLVKCDLGQKNVLISQGCSNYIPDNTASCKGMSVCYYNKNKGYSGIKCDIHGYIGNKREYCPDHAALEEDGQTGVSSDRSSTGGNWFVWAVVIIGVLWFLSE